MIDVSTKYSTLRTAIATAVVTVSEATLQRIESNDLPKRDPLIVARVAGVQAAKRTPDIIPYCHPVTIDYVGIEFVIEGTRITITSTVRAIDRTGVEMEAMTAASVAALTLYDMLKPIDEQIEISSISLTKKRGGKSTFNETFEQPIHAAVLVMSDRIHAGKKSDSSGKAIVERLEKFHVIVDDYRIVPDEVDIIAQTLVEYADEKRLNLVLTTGGTGFSPRDCTPEAMQKVIDREIPGIPEAMRAHGQRRTPYSMLSRAKAGLRGDTLIVNLPGSSKGVIESLDGLLPGLLHAFPMISGGDGWKKHDREAHK